MADEGSTFGSVIKVAIALIAAGGGLVAWLNYFGPDEFATDAAIADTSLYMLEGEPAGTLGIAPKSELLELIDKTPDTGSGILELTLDVTNRGPRTVSLNRLTLVFDDIAAVRQRFLMIEHDGTLGTDVLGALGLEVDGQGSDWARVRVPDATTVEALKTTIAAGSSDGDLTMYEDTAGVTHRPFSRTETVEVKLAEDKLSYDVSLGQTIDSRESVRIPLRISTQDRVRGTGRLILHYNGNETTELVQQLQIELVPAPLVEIVTPDD